MRARQSNSDCPQIYLQNKVNMYARFKSISIMHFQAILIHHRARILRELEQVTQTSLHRFDSQSCIEAASNENNRAYHFMCLLLHRHLLYDWRRNKSGITIYAHIWHLSIALITLWYFIDFSWLCDGLIFYSSDMKNEYQDYSVSALSCASHSIHIFYASCSFSFIHQFVDQFKNIFLYQFKAVQNVYFLLTKKNKCKKHRVPVWKKLRHYLKIHLRNIKTRIPSSSISHARSSMPLLGAHRFDVIAENYWRSVSRDTQPSSVP